MKRGLRYLCLLVLFVTSFVMGYQYDVDFPTLYRSVLYAVTSRFADIYGQPGMHEQISNHVFNTGRYFYLPFSLIFFAPFGHLSYDQAKALWLLILSGCFVTFWSCMGSLFHYMRDVRTTWLWLILFIMSVNPIHNSFQSNNISLLIAILVFGAEVLAQKKTKSSELGAGILVTVAAALKIFPAFVCFYYLLVKSNRTRLGLVLGTILVLGLPFLWYGPSSATALYQGFLTNITQYGADNNYATTPDINSLPTLILRGLTVSGMTDAVTAARLANIAVLLISAIFFGWAFQLKRTGELERLGETQVWSLCLALMAFLNPSSRPYYFIFYVPAFATLIQFWEAKRRPWELAAILGSCLLIAFTQEGVVGKTFNDQLELWRVPTLGMLILCASLAVVLQQRTSELRATRPTTSRRSA